MSFIIHTLLKTIRLDALLSYHNCLAGGGHDHQALEKIKASLKILLAKDVQRHYPICKIM